VDADVKPSAPAASCGGKLFPFILGIVRRRDASWRGGPPARNGRHLSRMAALETPAGHLRPVPLPGSGPPAAEEERLPLPPWATPVPPAAGPSEAAHQRGKAEPGLPGRSICSRSSALGTRPGPRPLIDRGYVALWKIATDLGRPSSRGFRKVGPSRRSQTKVARVPASHQIHAPSAHEGEIAQMSAKCPFVRLHHLPVRAGLPRVRASFDEEEMDERGSADNSPPKRDAAASRVLRRPPGGETGELRPAVRPGFGLQTMGRTDDGWAALDVRPPPHRTNERSRSLSYGSKRRSCANRTQPRSCGPPPSALLDDVAVDQDVAAARRFSSPGRDHVSELRFDCPEKTSHSVRRAGAFASPPHQN